MEEDTVPLDETLYDDFTVSDPDGLIVDNGVSFEVIVTYAVALGDKDEEPLEDILMVLDGELVLMEDGKELNVSCEDEIGDSE